MIDTGASHTLISQDEVDDIGIQVGIEDEIITSYGIGGKEHAFSKLIEGIQVGDFVLRDIPIDFTTFKYHNINGLLGLDILVEGKFNVDLENFRLYIIRKPYASNEEFYTITDVGDSSDHCCNYNRAKRCG